MGQALREASNCCLGRVVCRVSPDMELLVKKIGKKFPSRAYGTFVMPCFDPVLMMTD
jgi:hypothetical protein